MNRGDALGLRIEVGVWRAEAKKRTNRFGADATLRLDAVFLCLRPQTANCGTYDLQGVNKVKKATKRIILLILPLAISTLLVSCAAQQELRQIPPPTPLEMVQPTPPYIVQPGDQLSIKFFYNPELNETVTVRPDGKISLQLVDEVQAAGLQPVELDEVLTRRYSLELKRPTVTVIVTSFTGQRIYVGGEVTQQREMILSSGMTVVQAIFQAGGFKETASPENAILIRLGPKREPVAMRLDLQDAMMGKGAGASLVLRPSDIVYIPKSYIAEANKWVNQYIERLILFRGFSVGATYEINNNQN